MIAVGQKFGRWTVVAFVATSKLRCRCECGTERLVAACRLKSGESKSCGCFRRDIRRTHGLSKTPEHAAWSSMLNRCRCPSQQSYRLYGARGIRVCDRWQKSFAAFLEDMGRKPTPKHSLDRIDSNGNYEPSNCRWATAFEQQRNKRDSHFLTFNGETMCISAWSERTGFKQGTIWQRVKLGWPVEKVLTAPLCQTQRTA